MIPPSPFCTHKVLPSAFVLVTTAVAAEMPCADSSERPTIQRRWPSLNTTSTAKSHAIQQGGINTLVVRDTGSPGRAPAMVDSPIDVVYGCCTQAVAIGASWMSVGWYKRLLAVARGS